MINLIELEKLFDATGFGKSNAVILIDGNLQLDFYDTNYNKRRLIIGSKNVKNDNYSWFDEDKKEHKCRWTTSIFTNTWSRILEGYNLGEIIK